MGPRTLSQQWGPHPSHHLRMLRGACTVLGVSGLEWSEASRRAVETPDHPFCRAAAGAAVRCVTALWGSMGNSSVLKRVRSSLTASPWPCEGHPRALGSRWAEDCVGVGEVPGPVTGQDVLGAWSASPAGRALVSSSSSSSDQPRGSAPAQAQAPAQLCTPTSQGPHGDFLWREGQPYSACWKPPSCVWH